MREQRSASQILFGFLPEQTVDLQGHVWRVTGWINPRHESIDLVTLRRALVRAAAPWAAADNDGGYVEHLRQGRDVQVLSLNRNDGVAVEPFPRVWMCKRCNRLSTSLDKRCPCGTERAKGQLHFVGYCDRCGALREPYIPGCQQHKQVRVVFPGTSSAREIRFDCPVCERLIRQGFGFPRCQCGQGSLTFNVHRSASVFTPRTVVVVNAPSPERVRDLTAAGGPTRALSWVLDGMQTRSFRDAGLTKEALVQTLTAQGLDENLARSMADQAAEAGQLAQQDSEVGKVEEKVREEAESEAVTIALAVDQSRTTLADLEAATDAASALGLRYRSSYRVASQSAGLEGVELVDTFPVLTGNFGYTRGGSTPGDSRLVPYRDRTGRYAIYSELGVTEALFFRLRPSTVAGWLNQHGAGLDAWTDDATARVAIVNSCLPPDPGAGPDSSPGSLLLTLVHSYSHRLIRLLAVHAGIDREALSELLVPLHQGFFVYAAARGEFVLGGLQAVFETGLDDLLTEFVDADGRCALDPGCRRHGGACMACLHIGEPSCRYFNGFLNRSMLDGPSGFLAIASADAQTRTGSS
jgi:hypothetical protein